MPSITHADVIACAKVSLQRSIKASKELAAVAAKPERAAITEPGFVAEMIAQEQTRAGAVMDVLSQLCPEITAELRDLHTAAAAEMRDIRYAVIESICKKG